MKKNPLRTDESGRYLVPLREAAKKLCISPETLYRWIRQGMFPEPIKQGSRSYYAMDDLESHLAKLKRTLNPSPIHS